MILILVMIGSITGGCGVKQATRDEFISQKNLVDNARIREYQESPEVILRAAERVLYESDHDYIAMNQDKNTYRSMRKWMSFYVFGSAFGEDYWVISASKNDLGKTIVSAKCWHGPTSGGLIPMPLTSGGDENNYILSAHLYNLFFKRLDYMLGKTNVWLSCKDAEIELKKSDLRFERLTPLCSFANHSVPQPLVIVH